MPSILPSAAEVRSAAARITGLVRETPLIASPELPARAGASIAGLALTIVASAVGLMPEGSATLYAIAVLVAALGASAVQLAAVRAIVRNARDTTGERIVRGGMGMLAIAAFAAGAVLVLAGAGGVGLTVIGFGAVVAVVASILMAWVVLVEVLR